MIPDIVDHRFPQPILYLPERKRWAEMFWNTFFLERVQDIFRAGGMILDIGGGLRIDEKRGNRLNEQNRKSFGAYLDRPGVSYRVSDYTDQYHPDYVEDIHQLSFGDGSMDAVICMAVLEHVYDPKTAAEEIVRVLKPGGLAFLYVPFIYRYHANTTDDYKDYYRYSKDGIGYLFRECAHIEICPVRGLFESLLRFTPLHTFPLLARLLRVADWTGSRMRMISSRQASGYYIFLRK